MEQSPKAIRGPRSYIGLTSVILLLVAGASAALYMANRGLNEEVGTKRSELQKIEAEIAQLKSDRDLVLTEAILGGQAAIGKAVDSGRAQDYLEALSALEAKYGITFDGFAFQDGKIATTVVAVTDAGANGAALAKQQAIRKLQTLIRDAREAGSLDYVTKASKDAKKVQFVLGRISYVSGDDSRRVASVTLTVK